MPGLSPAAAVRLVKLLGLTGSVHDAEALAAIRKAGELVRAAGLTWSDVICPLDPAPGGAVVQWREPAVGDHIDTAMVCIYSGARLTNWDKKFLVSISQRVDPLSEKQWAQLNRILDNCRHHACCDA